MHSFVIYFYLLSVFELTCFERILVSTAAFCKNFDGCCTYSC